MLNNITIMGRLTKDVELRTTQNETAVATFTIACERDYGEKDKKLTDFVECVAWRRTAEFASKYLTKGMMVIVNGRLQSRKWEDRDGNKRVNWEILVEDIYFAERKTRPEEPARLEELPDDEGELPF